MYVDIEHLPAALIYLAIGLVFFGLSIFMLVADSQRKRRCSLALFGVVAGYEVEQHEAKGVYMYHLCVQFEFQGGQVIYSAPQGSGRMSYHIGAKIPIYVNPKDPEDLYIPGKNFALVSALIFLISSLFLVGMSVLTLYWIFAN